MGLGPHQNTGTPRSLNGEQRGADDGAVARWRRRDGAWNACIQIIQGVNLRCLTVDSPPYTVAQAPGPRAFPPMARAVRPSLRRSTAGITCLVSRRLFRSVTFRISRFQFSETVVLDSHCDYCQSPNRRNQGFLGVFQVKEWLLFP